ncbi:SET domain-containing protein-lysine N-methyltransferase [Pelomonas sp. SE-A7]|uniref:SET domain-containing protein n=1 Tax=Pelomonas sp. SE-A7 TaxID=3054953 RepID=UPI00259CA164|nr:SET domain-containing protein-lysine N-methyltransferase [Pelomonas sp. SE-A7]MDM4765030.1 SET domain-containing protein-lysine N-methyltransferase [Pelomonas sp. SE-A7]
MAFAFDPSTQARAVEVRRSRIDGYGVFAAEAIPAEALIGWLTGEAITVAEARRRAEGRQRLMLVELSNSRAIDATRSADAMRFTNHGCQPNARLRVEDGEIAILALRGIASGEEITVDYGSSHHEGRLACRCGAAGCAGWL